MPKTGNLTLISGANNLIFSARSKEEAAKVKSDFGWMGEDYRQAIVGSAIEDAIPKEEDFLPFIFRHITATTVGAGTWKATTFNEKVIKAARKLLEFKPAFVNHTLEIGNVIGVVGNAKFTPKFKAKDGTLVPGGLDAPIWIDAKLHADLCRKLQAFPVPHIQSVSITVTYEWEPSHVFTDSSGNDDDWEFERKIGHIIDDEMVTRIVTKIIDIFESSLVWLGADPFAKILDENGDPLNIEKSAIVGMSAFDKDPLIEMYKDNNRYFIADNSFKKENSIYLREHITRNFEKSGKSTPRLTTKKTNIKMEAVIQYLSEFLGKPEDEITVDLIKGHLIKDKTEFNKLKAEAGKVEQLTADKNTAEESLTAETTAKETAEGQVADFEKIMPHKDLEEFEVPLESVADFAKVAMTNLEDNRKEVLRQYKLTVEEGKENEAIVGVIKKATSEEIVGLAEQYGAKLLDGTFSATCTECGNGDNITYRSSQSEGEADEPSEPEPRDMADAMRS